MIKRVIYGIRYASQLEKYGLASLQYPPRNYFLSPKLKGNDLTYALDAVEIYANISVGIDWATKITKAVSACLVVALLIKLVAS